MGFKFSDIFTVVNKENEKMILIMLLIALLIGVPSGYFLGVYHAQAEYEELRKIKIQKLEKERVRKEELHLFKQRLKEKQTKGSQ